MDPAKQTQSSQGDLPAPTVLPQAGMLGPQPAVPVKSASPALSQIPPAQPAGPVTQTGHSPYSPAVADDVDLIEKEWVLKAKAIVAETKDDPSRQNRDINSFKADYLKTRYSKDIKINEA